MQKKELKKFDVEKKNPVRRFLSDSRPLQLRRYLRHDAKTSKIILGTLTMLRHQAAENSVITSGAAKKYFSPREIIVIAGF